MEAGNCPCIKLVKVLLKKLQNDLFKVLYVPWITAYKNRVDAILVVYIVYGLKY